ncbi:hypothetical protein ACF0H5_006882 [Mactra antiquata]
MGWGDGWGEKKKWGQTSWNRNHSNEDPHGQHLNMCMAATRFPGSPFDAHYNINCPGCRDERSMQSWSKNGKGATNAVVQVVSLFVGKKPSKQAKKSLWG